MMPNKMTMTLLAIVFMVLLFGDVLRLRRLGYHLDCNQESIKVWCAQGGYRSWTISYSDGLMWDGRRWVSLWRRPQFHHVDMREFDFTRPDGPVGGEEKQREERKDDEG